MCFSRLFCAVVVIFGGLGTSVALNATPENVKSGTIQLIKADFSHSTLAAVGIMLEQRNSCFDNKNGSFFIYLIAIPILLWGIVLSNAYKGDNIMKIIAPLPLRNYDTLKQIQGENFTVLSSYVPNYSTKQYYEETGAYSLLGNDEINITLINLLRDHREHLKRKYGVPLDGPLFNPALSSHQSISSMEIWCSEYRH